MRTNLIIAFNLAVLGALGVVSFSILSRDVKADLAAEKTNPRPQHIDEAQPAIADAVSDSPRESLFSRIFSARKTEQKIIWEWTGGALYSREVGSLATSRCAHISEPLTSHTNSGWRIISAYPAERIVYGGAVICRGREVIIER